MINYKEVCKRYYPKYYSVNDLKKFVKAGKITEDDFYEITGEEYTV